jgi:hypothetical protein
VTWEADHVLSYRIVALREGENPIGWAVDGAQFPNFTLTATRMAGNELDQAKLDIEVQRDLRVTVAPARPTVAPGDPVELDVTTLDQLGRPVAAELSLAVVDESLLRLYGDTLPAIGPFFFSQARTGAFATESTNTFRYAPGSVPVAAALVEELERKAAELADQAAGAAWAMAAADRGGRPEFRGAPGPANEPASSSASTPAPGFAMGLSMRAGSRPLRPEAQAGRRSAAAKSRQFGKAAEVDGEEAKLAANGAARFDDQSETALGRDLFFAEQGEQVAPPRQRFVETAYWNPAVVTGTDGFQ